jgi:RNA-directed DNA polymerase
MKTADLIRHPRQSSISSRTRIKMCRKDRPLGEAFTDPLSGTLKLIVNKAKSRVVKTNDLHFPGFTFRGKKIRWSDQALKDFKYRIRRLTKRSWGISMQRRLRELRLYIRGWINYFGLSEYYRPLPGLDEWIRRRLRMCYLKQWRRPRTRIRNLIKLGTRTQNSCEPWTKL